MFAGKFFLRDHELRIDRDQSERLEIFLQIVVHVVDDRADVGVPLADIDGVAVRLGARDAADRDAAAGAADVLDDDRLAEDRTHLLGHDARGNVGRAARRERHHQRDLLRRKGLRLRARHTGQRGQRDARQSASSCFAPQSMFRRSLRLDAGRLDNRPPLLDLFLLELRQRLRRVHVGGKNSWPMSSSRLCVAGSLTRLHQRIVEFGDDVLRRAFRHP